MIETRQMRNLLPSHNARIYRRQLYTYHPAKMLKFLVVITSTIKDGRNRGCFPYHPKSKAYHIYTLVHKEGNSRA